MKITTRLVIIFLVFAEGIAFDPFAIPEKVTRYGKALLSNLFSKDSTEENGQLSFFEGKIIRQLVTKASDIGKNVLDKFVPSHTKGLDTNKTYSGPLEFINHIKVIFPGTKFCGHDNIAEDSDDLGYFDQTDSCCRQHDSCEQSIAAGETKFGLHNTGLFTRSHCDCDEKFYQCLKRTDSVISNNIGFTFFSVLGPQCFKLEYPIKGCYEKEWGRCVDYTIDKEQEMRIQWFDNPTYTIMQHN